MKFANLIVKTTRVRNYGDDIQIHAIKLLYEQMGIEYEDVVRITLEEIFSYDGDEYLVLPINFPFWGNYPQISKKIIPVYLGVTFSDESVFDSLCFKQFVPIGCRDQRAYEILKYNGISAYINGCLTLTLPKRDVTKEYSKVYIVDVCDELYECIPPEIKRNACFKTHMHYGRKIEEEESLSIYEEYRDNAKLVITSRLHCASPCVAYGIPVIYASNILSKRSTWLSNIIPIYSAKDFEKIDWNPMAPDVENIKQIVIQNAIDQIQEAWDKNFKMCRLNEMYESKLEKKAVRDDMWYPIEFCNKNWDRDCEIQYIIWGVTQTAEALYKYISQNFPNARLVGVIDLYKEVEFLGFKTRKLDLIDENIDAICFVAVESANQMAKEYYAKFGKDNFVYCWKNSNYIIRN